MHILEYAEEGLKVLRCLSHPHGAPDRGAIVSAMAFVMYEPITAENA
jgi:hypothetical protein